MQAYIYMQVKKNCALVHASNLRAQNHLNVRQLSIIFSTSSFPVVFLCKYDDNCKTVFLFYVMTVYNSN